jgi:type II secretory pathway predicted ATPase ExeA
MFQQFFGLREQPFGVTPDPRYLYLGDGHREALASLFYGIEANRGFLALIAKPGMGKTTLLFHLLEKFRNRARTAFLFQTQCSSREFMRFLLAEVGLESDGDFVHMHEQFNRCLEQEARAGNRFIIIIDEAQNLDASVLETVRLLSDFETPQAKLLQIILAGQPELGEKLAQPGLNQLHQRIASFSSLKPFGLDGTSRFIEHRLRVAGYSGARLFDPRAVGRIAELSAGIPRNINNLCFHSLSLAFALRKRTIDMETVEEVAQDLDIRHLLAEQDSLPDSDGLDVRFDSGASGSRSTSGGYAPVRSATERASSPPPPPRSPEHGVALSPDHNPAQNLAQNLAHNYGSRVETVPPVSAPLAPISPREARDYMQKVVQTLKEREQNACASTTPMTRPEEIVQ